MELKLSEGRYVPAEAGGLRRVEGTEEKLQRILCRLSARRGGFFPMPDFGSALHTLGSLKPSARAAAARQFVHEALEAEQDVEVLDVDCREAEDGLFLISVEMNIAGDRSEMTLRV